MMVSGECCGGVQLLLVQLVKLFSKMEERLVHIVRFLLCVCVSECVCECVGVCVGECVWVSG